jgi:aminoglycoside phosphotransferase (APT) family kinase protein
LVLLTEETLEVLTGQPATLLGRILNIPPLRGREVCELHLNPAGNTLVAETADHVVRVAWCAPMDIECEARMWAEAVRVGIPAPELVASGTLDGHQYMVYTRLAGWPEPTSAAVLDEAGVKLAALHEAATHVFPRQLVARPRRMNRFALARSFLRRHVEHVSPGVVDCVELAELDWTCSFHTPTHGDFRGSNLLARGLKLSGVLDWSDARRASREADLGGVDWPRFRRVLGGYLTVCPDVRGAELLGYFVGRHAALAEAGVIGRHSALRVIDLCAQELTGRRLLDMGSAYR